MERFVCKCVLAILLLFSLKLKAQFVEDIYGTPYMSKQEGEIDGSPFFLNSWNKGIVILMNEKKIKDIELNYEQYLDQPVFKDKTGNILLFEFPVREFVITTPINSYHFKNGYLTDEKHYYQILVSGSVTLLKRDIKVINTIKQYSSASITKSYQQVIAYYLFKDNKLLKLSGSLKKIEAILNDRKEVSDFIKREKIDMKNQDDLISLISFYNSK